MWAAEQSHLGYCPDCYFEWCQAEPLTCEKCGAGYHPGAHRTDGEPQYCETCYLQWREEQVECCVCKKKLPRREDRVTKIWDASWWDDFLTYCDGSVENVFCHSCYELEGPYALPHGNLSRYTYLAIEKVVIGGAEKERHLRYGSIWDEGREPPCVGRKKKPA